MSSVAFLHINKIERNDLKRGDHIYSYRSLHFYSHHGIYVGEETVIHFNRTHDKIILKWRQHQACNVCGYDERKDKGAIKTCLKCFSRGHELYIFKYDVSSLRFFFDAAGACSTNECDDPSLVVQRAESILGRDNAWFAKFSLTNKNCECFAFYCKTGKRLAHQVVYAKAFSDVAYRQIRLRNIVNPFRAVKSFAKILVVPKMELLERDKMARHQPLCT